MNNLNLTDFYINNLKSSKDLNISRWKRIERRVFTNLSTLLHSNRRKRSLNRPINHSKQTHGSRFGLHHEITDYELNVKLRSLNAP